MIEPPIFDERERRSGLFLELDKEQRAYRVDTLLIGDVAISSKVCAEIKRVRKSKNSRYDDYSDLFNSFKDDHIYKQVKNIKENYEVGLLIIEIEKGASLINQKFTEEAFASFRFSMEITFDIHVYITTSHQDTINLIYTIWEKETDPHIVSACNKTPRPKSLYDLQQYFLSGLIDVGDEKTKQLLDLFETPLNVIAWIIDTIITFTKNNNPRKPKDVPAGFGAKFFLKNQKLLTGDIIKNEPNNDD